MQPSDFSAKGEDHNRMQRLRHLARAGSRAAKPLAELLTVARQSSEKMDKLIEMLKNVQVYAVPRHSTKDQADAITHC